MVFYTSENVLSAWWQTILVLLNTAVSRQLNMVVSRIISDCRNELGAIFKMIFSLSFSFLFPCVVVCRGLYIDVPSQEIHLSFVFFPMLLCARNRSLFSFHSRFFFFNQYPVTYTVMAPPWYCVTLECDLSLHIWYWHSCLFCCRYFWHVLPCITILAMGPLPGCHKCSNTCNTHILYLTYTQYLSDRFVSLNLCLLPSLSSVTADLIF